MPFKLSDVLTTFSVRSDSLASAPDPPPDAPSMNPFYVDVTTIVAVADLKASDTILVVNCTYENVLLEVVKRLGPNHGRIVGIDHRVNDLQQLGSILRAEGLYSKIELFIGDNTHLHEVTGLQDPSQPASHSTFDMVFAPIPLPLDPRSHSMLLSTWASYLSSPDSSMVVQLYPSSDDFVLLAGIQAVNAQGDITVRFSCMSDHEWSLAETGFQALARSAGIEVAKIQRLSLQGSDVVDLSELFEVIVTDAWEHLERKDPAWVGQDGTFSAGWKQMFVRGTMDCMSTWPMDKVAALLLSHVAQWESSNTLGENECEGLLAGSLGVVPVVASMAAVLKCT
ncbi:MAG: hypothetical protein LQ349_000315 [Xanthoria aureola]|nr:MAG: hypothetical protein LQ349_000315 [Xanthoria aureola]